MSPGWKRPLAVAALGLGTILACGDEPVEPPPPQALYAPESWAGVWDITLVEHECGDDSVLAVTSFPDTLCAGESLAEFLLGDEQGELDCTGSWTDTDLAADCSGSSTVLGCETIVVASFTASLTDSAFGGLVRVDVRYDCEEPIPDDCLDVDLDALFSGPQPASCPQTSTGALKALVSEPGRRR